LPEASLQLSLYSQFTPEELEKKSVTPPYFIESALDGDFKSQTVTTDVSPFIARFNPDMTNMIKTGKPSQTEDLEPKNLFIMLGSSKGKQEVKKNISSPEAYNKTEKAQGQEEQQKVFTMRGSLKEKEESRYNATSPQQPMNTPIQNTPSPSNP
jgi:hypothetical protein